MAKKKYKIITGHSNYAREAAAALEKEVNSLLDEGYSLNGAPFVASSDDSGVTLAQCLLRKD